MDRVSDSNPAIPFPSRPAEIETSDSDDDDSLIKDQPGSVPSIYNRTHILVEQIDAGQKLDLYTCKPGGLDRIEDIEKKLSSLTTLRLARASRRLPPVLRSLTSLTTLQIDDFDGKKLDTLQLRSLEFLVIRQPRQLTELHMQDEVKLRFHASRSEKKPLMFRYANRKEISCSPLPFWAYASPHDKPANQLFQAVQLDEGNTREKLCRHKSVRWLVLQAIKLQAKQGEKKESENAFGPMLDSVQKRLTYDFTERLHDHLARSATRQVFIGNLQYGSFLIAEFKAMRMLGQAYRLFNVSTIGHALSLALIRKNKANGVMEYVILFYDPTFPDKHARQIGVELTDLEECNLRHSPYRRYLDVDNPVADSLIIGLSEWDHEQFFECGAIEHGGLPVPTESVHLETQLTNSELTSSNFLACLLQEGFEEGLRKFHVDLSSAWSGIWQKFSAKHSSNSKLDEAHFSFLWPVLENKGALILSPFWKKNFGTVGAYLCMACDFYLTQKISLDVFCDLFTKFDMHKRSFIEACYAFKQEVAIDLLEDHLFRTSRLSADLAKPLHADRLLSILLGGYASQTVALIMEAGLANALLRLRLKQLFSNDLLNEVFIPDSEHDSVNDLFDFFG